MNHVLIVFHGTVETYVFHPVSKAQVQYDVNWLWIFLHAVFFFFPDKLGDLLLWTQSSFKFRLSSYHDQMSDVRNMGALVGR